MRPFASWLGRSKFSSLLIHAGTHPRCSGCLFYCTGDGPGCGGARGQQIRKLHPHRDFLRVRVGRGACEAKGRVPPLLRVGCSLSQLYSCGSRRGRSRVRLGRSEVLCRLPDLGCHTWSPVSKFFSSRGSLAPRGGPPDKTSFASIRPAWRAQSGQKSAASMTQARQSVPQ